jgi:signal transduction histidine kinase
MAQIDNAENSDAAPAFAKDAAPALAGPASDGLIVRLRRRYEDLTLGRRLAVSFAVVLALVAALALAGLVFMQSVLLGVDGFSRRADLGAAAAELEIGMRSLEIAVRDHLAEGDGDSFDDAARHHDAMSLKLRVLSAAATGEDVKSAALASQALEAYRRGFARIVDFKVERARLTEEDVPKLSAAARAPLEALKTVGGVDSAATVADVAARVAAAQEMALRFTERRDMMDGQRAQNEFAAARDRLLDLNRYSWMSGVVDNMAAAAAAIDALEKTLDRLDALMVEQDAVRADVLTPNAAVVVERARALRLSGEREAERLRAGLGEKAGRFGLVALWVAGGVLLLGGLTVWLTARGVARPVRDAAQALAILAQGRGDDQRPAAQDLDLGFGGGGGGETAELVRAVAAVRDNAGRMSQALSETTAERDRLAAEVRRLSAVNAAKSDFLVNLGQLLHGPLNDVAAQIQALMIEMHRHGLTEVANDAEAAQWSAERLTGQLDALMDYARIEAGRAELCLQDFDVARLLVETRERTLNVADLHGVSLTATAGMEVGGMHSDFAKVRQALLNLLDNACLHSQGSVVTLTAERQEIDGRGWIAFTVTDNGKGFKADRAMDLFMPFVRGAKTATGGAGLGLTLVAHYAAMLGGELEVASAQGRGARFVLRLPAVYGAADEDRPLRLRIGEPGGVLGAPTALLGHSLTPAPAATERAEITAPA